jgi:hypothetical protein
MWIGKGGLGRGTPTLPALTGGKKVSEVFTLLQNIGPYLETAAWVAGIALALITLACIVYVAKTAAEPFLVVLKWMFAHTPGERPNDIVAGISFGGRILVWAMLVALVVWFFLR